jgi:hypothetical protein
MFKLNFACLPERREARHPALLCQANRRDRSLRICHENVFLESEFLERKGEDSAAKPNRPFFTHVAKRAFHDDCCRERGIHEESARVASLRVR